MLTDRQIEDEIIRKGEAFQVGQWMKAFKASEHWKYFKRHILDEMEREAFSYWCDTNPKDEEKTRQFQVFGQVTRLIPLRMDNLISIGELSLEQLNKLKSLPEGEDDGE